MTDVVLEWRGELSDAEVVELVESYDGNAAAGWWDTIRPHSFGWVAARAADGLLVGFVNVVSDGGDHAFLIDTKTCGSFQRRGIGTPGTNGCTSTSTRTCGRSTSTRGASSRPTPA